MTKAVAGALVVQTAMIAGLLTVVADQIAHTHVEKLGGVNIWGYRGPVMHQKKRNEIRIAVVGGDLSFGWGVAASETLAPAVRQLVALALDRPGTAAVTFTSVTLGARGLAPHEYAARIERYAYLRPDVICVVPDPLDHVPTAGPFVPDRRSRAFTTWGYSPILPLVLEEKGARGKSPLRRILGGTLDSVDGLFGTDTRGAAAVVPDPAYIDALQSAVRTGLRIASAVVVVLAPHDQDGLDRARVRQLLASADGGRRVRVVDLADDPAMHDEGLRLDGFSFSTAGHAAAAQDVAPAVIDLIRERDGKTR